METTPTALLCGALIAIAFGANSPSGPVFGPWGVTLAYMDPSVNPGTDFFRYTNGSGLKTASVR